MKNERYELRIMPTQWTGPTGPVEGWSIEEWTPDGQYFREVHPGYSMGDDNMDPFFEDLQDAVNAVLVVAMKEYGNEVNVRLAEPPFYAGLVLELPLCEEV